jgi:hypothetical protein
MAAQTTGVVEGLRWGSCVLVRLLLLWFVPCGLASGAAPDLSALWHSVHRACEKGRCHRHSNSSEHVKNTTDCKARLLMYEYGLRLIPRLSPQREVFDALELENCGLSPPSARRPAWDLEVADAGCSFYVDFASGSDEDPGSHHRPFKTIAQAVAATRRTAAKPCTVLLLPGVHFLERTIELNAQDSGLTISGLPGAEDVWISGGRRLHPKWTKVPGPGFIYKTAVEPGFNVSGLNTLKDLRRLTLARYPNGDPELCRTCWEPAEAVTNWPADVACVGKAHVVYKDLRVCGPDGLCKRDSAMWDTYNTYTNGHGGCCAVWEGDLSPFGPMGSYYCGNSSAGGWVGYNDPRGDNLTQGQSPILPSGMEYNASLSPGLAALKSAKGGRLTVWRNQDWYLNMFEIAAHVAPNGSSDHGRIDFAYERGHVKGGWQGGRGWDKQSPHLEDADKPGYIIAGRWMVQDVKEALDSPNEWWFDPVQRELYVWPNATSKTVDPGPPGDLVAVNLKTLFAIRGGESKARNITIQGLKLRDAADISMEPWAVPSGGDWGLHRGGAVFLEDTEDCTVANCTFERLDGNAIFVSGYNRRTLIADNEFAWIGHSCAAGWGYTDEDDGTNGLQPRFTSLLRNYAREIGIIQKQSSFWFQAKACLTTLKDNVIFNGPRAGINLNDGFGGGNLIESNLIFNQCRETGDHGPINSWDRQPFLTDVLGQPSYAAAMSNITGNFIWANYGSSQGFDTDDGSSWYNISDNVMWQADGYKMDFGGHDTVITNNLFWKDGGDDQNCINTMPFLPGHGTVFKGNKCVLPHTAQIGHVSGGTCPGNAPSTPGVEDPTAQCGVTFGENSYFWSGVEGGFRANLTINTGAADEPYPVWHAWGNDPGSQVFALPSDEVLLYWAREKLRLPTGPKPEPPAPLPPAPPPHFPDTCVGQCAANHYCCTGNVSGCQQPSCVMGCAMANFSASEQSCVASCDAAASHCSYTIAPGFDIQMCGSCPEDCPACDGNAACRKGCQLAFDRRRVGEFVLYA